MSALVLFMVVIAAVGVVKVVLFGLRMVALFFGFAIVVFVVWYEFLMMVFRALT